METRVDEIAERIYRLSTFLPEVGPSGFTFNQFLVYDDLLKKSAAPGSA
jgi:hypothetical protein